MRQRYYRGAASGLAFLDAAVAATSAVFAYHHGWTWLNNNTDGSTIEPLKCAARRDGGTGLIVTSATAGGA